MSVLLGNFSLSWLCIQATYPGTTRFSDSGNSVAVVHNGRIMAETGKRRYECPAWIVPWAKSCTTATPHEESRIQHVYIPGFCHHHQHFHTPASPLKLTRSFSASTLQEPHVGGLKKKSQLWCVKTKPVRVCLITLKAQSWKSTTSSTGSYGNVTSIQYNDNNLSETKTVQTVRLKCWLVVQTTSTCLFCTSTVLAWWFRVLSFSS